MGRPFEHSYATPAKLVFINDIDVTKGIVHATDQFGKAEILPYRVRQGKGLLPKVGEAWIVERSASGIMHFSQVVNEVLNNAVGVRPKEFHSSPGELDALGLLVDTTIAVDSLPWSIDCDVFMTAIAFTNWDTIVMDATCLHGGYKRSNGTNGDAISFDVVLAAGTWVVELMHVRAVDCGTYNITLGATSLGTISGTGATLANKRDAAAGVAIAQTGKHRLTLAMTGSGYGKIQHIQLKRLL